MITFLLFVLPVSLLLTLCHDASRNFAALSLPARAALVAASALYLIFVIRARKRQRMAPLSASTLVWLAGAGLILGLAGLYEALAARRLDAGWEAGARHRLERRATIVEEDFALFMGQVLQSTLPGGELPAGPAELFEEVTRRCAAGGLPEERFGLSVYGSDGSLLAWGGNATDPPVGPGALTDPFRQGAVIGGDPAAPRLYAHAVTDEGAMWVAEYLLRVPRLPGAGAGEGRLEFDFLSRWNRVAPAHVQLGGPPERQDALERLFERNDDRLWGRMGRRKSASLTIPLRVQEGAPHIASVTLRDRSAADTLAALQRQLRLGVILLLAAGLIVVWGLPLWHRPPIAPLPFLLLTSGAIWSIRWVLLQIADAADLPDLALYDITLYASSALGGLMRSPADLLLSALACLIQVWGLRRFLARLAVPLPARRARRLSTALLAALLPALAAGAFALHALIDQMALDSRIDILRVLPDQHFVPRTALHATLFMLIASLVFLLLAGLDFALRCRGVANPEAVPGWMRGDPAQRIPLLLRAGAAVFVLTALYVPLLHHAYARLRIEFFESDLVPRVQHQAQRRFDVLYDSLLAAEEPEFASLAYFATEGEAAGDPGVSYRLWSRTSMASMGLASTLRLYDDTGRIVSSFEANVAPAAQVPFDLARRQAGGDPVEYMGPADLTVSQKIIFGSRWLLAPRQRPLLLVMSIVDDYANIPMMHSGDTYAPLLRSRAPSRTNPELLRFDPMLAVFDQNLERVYQSGDDIPPPTPAHLELLASRPVVWSSAVIGEHRSRIAYFEGENGMLFALTHPVLGPAGWLAGLLRLFLLNVALAIGFFAVRGSVIALRAGELPRFSLGSTFYGRLTVIYLLTALVPLLALSYFFTRFSTRELDRDLVIDGLRSLQTVRRMVNDYLQVSQSGEQPILDDDVLFWLSRVIRQEITLFVGDRRVATSAPELFSAKLVNERLNGRVHRSIFLGRAPYELTSPRPGVLILSAPLTVDRNGTMGVIALSLAAHRREVTLKTTAVRDAILISTFVTVLLLAIVGWLVARRVAGPIAMLAGAAGRLRAGDLDVRVTRRSNDEIGSLVSAFNDMAIALRRQHLDLESRKDYIEKILDSATTGVLSIDSAGALITINPAAGQLLAGGASPPAIGDDLLEILSNDPALHPLGRALSRALIGGADAEAEVDLWRGDRERRVRAVFRRFVPEKDAPAGVIVLLEDISEIVRSGRLAAWAEMARRIAHEVKNPLTPIQLSVEHLQRVWAARDERFDAVLRECLGNIKNQVRTLRHMASEFSAYARLPEIRPAPVAVDDLVRSALQPYITSPPPGVRFETDLPPGLPELMIDRAVVHRTLVNLIENALQAIDQEGTIWITARPEDGRGRPQTIRIEVRDDGAGIDPRTLSRLFEPYFSTRRGGTGLGLAIARKAAEEHGGSLDISSRQGEG
ncbi:MAG TPA: ATP-binding protein, partial [Candidatus Polarisedimenticolia bacterium]|nr:ATP-binding protein [Candidatus Polarisedimenticolia bacterium]